MRRNKMVITVKELFLRLTDDLEHIKLRQENQEIHNIKLLLKEQRQFDSNTLYIGRTSLLDKNNLSPIPAFLGIKDCSAPVEQLALCFTNPF